LSPLLSPETSPQSSPESRDQVLYCPEAWFLSWCCLVTTGVAKLQWGEGRLSQLVRLIIKGYLVWLIYQITLSCYYSTLLVTCPVTSVKLQIAN